MSVRTQALVAALVLAVGGVVTVGSRQNVLLAQDQATAGQVGHITKVESGDDDIVRLANGAVVEVTSGYLGYAGYRKDAVLLLTGSRCRLWIQGKRSYRSLC